MYLKASKHPAVFVLDVCFSDPIISVRRSISFKLNQMGPVVMCVHVASLSKCKVGLRLVESLYLVLEGFGAPSGCMFGCGLLGSWPCGASLLVMLGSRFMILLPGGGSLFEITSSPLGAFIKEVIL